MGVAFKELSWGFLPESDWMEHLEACGKLRCLRTLHSWTGGWRLELLVEREGKKRRTIMDDIQGQETELKKRINVTPQCQVTEREVTHESSEILNTNQYFWNGSLKIFQSFVGSRIFGSEIYLLIFKLQAVPKTKLCQTRDICHRENLPKKKKVLNRNPHITYCGFNGKKNTVWPGQLTCSQPESTGSAKIEPSRSRCWSGKGLLQVSRTHSFVRRLSVILRG